MKTNRGIFSVISLAAIVIIGISWPHQLPAKTAATKADSAAQWSVQVDKVDSGDVNLASSFQIAIYENLLDQLGKTKTFKHVYRSGDSNASNIADLLILKTTVEKYTAGSETRRAVTTVSGATKLKVRTQLCTRDGRVVLERVVNGNVRFFGSNLRATHNLARNVAKAMKEASLPEAVTPAPAQTSAASSIAKLESSLR